ncbi:SAG-related sequence [Besnoitia besnoiti]|uniref:SAG-related sequence n=1 Tax=Besnoitia besnoiti TaxID=94643 RepID=A0A2A9M9V4_BESBE|nr:SAG-related sequence [Besnoitia besnoiti]PFH35258.1 SAG-related sequence [Besnoitia besnoiti]
MLRGATAQRAYEAAIDGLKEIVGFLFEALPWWQQKCLAQESETILTCTVKKTTTECVCVNKSQELTSVETVTLSESMNGISVRCATNSDFVPSDKNKVCTGKAEEASLTACEPPSKKTTGGSAMIADFLSSSPALTPSVEWITSEVAKSLTFPSTNFPATDKAFLIGCRQNNKSYCLVSVNVKARKSVLEDKVLKCAYGTDSNTPVPEVTLDPTSNSLTVDCGEDGTMPLTGELPTVYYCKDSATDACDPVKDVTEILPGFAKEWWTPVNGLETAAKLTVPEGGFPVEPKTVVLGCNPKRAKAKVDAEPESHAEGGLPTCRVKVAFNAQSSSSGVRISLGFALVVLVSLM